MQTAAHAPLNVAVDHNPFDGLRAELVVSVHFFRSVNTRVVLISGTELQDAAAELTEPPPGRGVAARQPGQFVSGEKLRAVRPTPIIACVRCRVAGPC